MNRIRSTLIARGVLKPAPKAPNHATPRAKVDPLACFERKQEFVSRKAVRALFVLRCASNRGGIAS